MPDKAYIATYIVSNTLLFSRSDKLYSSYRISHGIDNKLNEIKHSAQLVTLSAQATGLWLNAIRARCLDPIFLSREMLFPRYDQLSLTPT